MLRRTWLLALALLAAAPAALAQPSFTISQPRGTILVENDTIPVVITITSGFPIDSVVVRVMDRQVRLTQDENPSRFIGGVPAAGLAEGPHTLYARATDIYGYWREAEETFTLTRPPPPPSVALTVLSPPANVLVRDDHVEVSASCVDAVPGAPCQLRAATSGGELTGTGSVNGTLPLPGPDGAFVAVSFTATGSNGVAATDTRYLRIERTTTWVDVDTVGGEIFDHDAHAFLVTPRTYVMHEELTSLEIVDRATGERRVIDFARTTYAREFRAFLAGDGALFNAGRPPGLPPGSPTFYYAEEGAPTEFGLNVVRAHGRWVLVNGQIVDLSSGEVVLANAAGVTLDTTRALGTLRYVQSGAPSVLVENGVLRELWPSSVSFVRFRGDTLYFVSNRQIIRWSDGETAVLGSLDPMANVVVAFEVENDWVTYSRSGPAVHWRHAPDGTVEVLPNFNNTISRIEGIDDQGRTMILSPPSTRYLVAAPSAPLSVGTDDGRAFWRDGAWYRVLGGTVSTLNPTLVAAEPAPGVPPDAAALGAPFPNPASGAVSLPLTLAAAGPLRWAVYDVLGRRVAEGREGARPAGPGTLALPTDGLPAGTYAVVVEADGARRTATFTVAR